jgi:8-oxo-dGTP pyrophosphatase MutT (NUDIX family)
VDIDFIINKFESLENLPGIIAHQEMSPMNRPLSYDQIDQSIYRESSVMFFVYSKGGVPYTVAIERNTYNGVHSGQISLPGGKLEVNDSSLFDTALRESKEEIGVKKENVMKLADLSTVFIPVSKFIVNPYVSILKEENPIFIADKREVAQIIEFPIIQIMENSNLLKKDIKIENGITLKNVPYFNISDHVVWGATALIFNEVKHIIQK